jgi:DNA-binding response OmpR family regulator
VLLCDLDPAICTKLRTLLEQQKYRVITAALSQEVIAQAAAQQPDVILLDLLMPNLNGWETMAQLKENPATQNIPIIVCSVCGSTETPTQATDCVDWVSQPFDESLLLRSLKHTLAQPSTQLRVLIVEDDADLAQVLVTLLEQHEIKAFHASSGREAIRLSQEINPNLLILDLVCCPKAMGLRWLNGYGNIIACVILLWSFTLPKISMRLNAIGCDWDKRSF